MPHGGTIFKFDNCLDASVVVVDVNRANHFLSLQISNSQRDLANGVTGR